MLLDILYSLLVSNASALVLQGLEDIVAPGGVLLLSAFDTSSEVA